MSGKHDSTARRGAQIDKRSHSLHDATLSLLDRAIDGLGSDQGDEAVHTARKATKRIRAALRLLRGSLGPGKYHRENRGVRDAARPLTAIRDSFVLQRTLRSMTGAPPPLERDLKSEYQRERRGFKRQGLHAALTHLKAARRHLSEFSAVVPETASAVEGLGNTYRAGRKALAKAKSNDDGALHEWRKQAKYLLNELELLRAVFGFDAKKLRRHADKLASILGDDHDLGVLSGKLRRYRATAPRLVQQIEKRRRSLRRQAAKQGAKLYGHSAKRVEARAAARLKRLKPGRDRAAPDRRGS
jgi:CHAD domain-containing protein